MCVCRQNSYLTPGYGLQTKYFYAMTDQEKNNNQKILQIVIAVAVGVGTFFLVQYLLNG